MLQWTWRRYLFQTVISFFSNIQDSNCGSYGSSIFYFFWGNSILFSIVAAQISFPTSSTQGFSFLQILPMLVQFSSVVQSCPTLCDPMNCSMPGLPVHHQLPKFTQTHVHRVGDAIQPSHPLSSPSPPAPNPSQHQTLFHWVNSSHQVAKVLEFQP